MSVASPETGMVSNKSQKKLKIKKLPRYIQRGISEFGLTKPIIAPRKVTWEITSNCNLACLHCDVDAKSSEIHDLSFPQIVDIIHQLKDFGISMIHFSGGEPLVRPDFFEIAKYALRNGLHIGLVTNGTLVTPEIAKRLESTGFKNVQVSLDGAKSTTHDKFRGVKGAFNKTIEGIKALVETRIPMTVVCTLTKDNKNEISDLVDLLVELKVQRLGLSDLIPVGRGRLLKDKILTNEEYPEMVKNVASIKKAYQNKIKIPWSGVAPPKALKPDDRRSVIVTKCYACFTGCNITSDGKVLPCYLLRLEAGNLTKQTIRSVWKSSEVFNQIRNRDVLEGYCGKCGYKYYCGGCRARAFAWFGKSAAPDPRCPSNTLDA